MGVTVVEERQIESRGYGVTHTAMRHVEAVKAEGWAQSLLTRHEGRDLVEGLDRGAQVEHRAQTP